MKEMYEYMTGLAPLSEEGSRREKQACTKAVLHGIRGEQKPRVRRSLRIALALSAAALGVSMIVPAATSAKRNDWHETYRFAKTWTQAEIEAHEAALAPILTRTEQRCTAGDYVLTMTGYASDGLAGTVFFKLTVPEGFDWQHPYLEATGTQLVSGDDEPLPASLTYLTGLTPSDTPNVYLAECALSLSERSSNALQTPPVSAVRFSEIVLRDEYTDFNDEGKYLSGSANPHWMQFSADFSLQTAPTDLCTLREDPQYGTIRVTPFGVYCYSFDDAEKAVFYREQRKAQIGPSLTLKSGEVLTPASCQEWRPWASVPEFTEEQIRIMESRGEDWQSERPSGGMRMIFPHPVSLDDVMTLNFAPYQF